MKVRLIDNDRLEFRCRVCHEKHLVDIHHGHSWNHSTDSPTIRPDIDVCGCLHQITDGRLDYPTEEGQPTILPEIA